MAEELPRINKVQAKKRRGEELTDAEQRQLEGHEAAQRIKNRRYPKGAYVHFKTTCGEMKVIVANSDEHGNYLIEYALGAQTVLRPKDVVESYLIFETTLLEQDEYLIGKSPYDRVVNKKGYIVKFYNSAFEQRRVNREEIVLPESEKVYKDSDWGMKVLL